MAFGKSKAAEQRLQAVGEASVLVNASALDNAVKALQWSPEPVVAGEASVVAGDASVVAELAGALAVEHAVQALQWSPEPLLSALLGDTSALAACVWLPAYSAVRELASRVAPNNLVAVAVVAAAVTIASGCVSSAAACHCN